MGVINASNVFLIFMVRVIKPCKTPTIKVIVVILWKGSRGEKMFQIRWNQNRTAPSSYRPLNEAFLHL